MVSLLVAGFWAIGLGIGHTMLLRSLTERLVVSGSGQALLIGVACLRLGLLVLVSSIVWRWGAGPGVMTLVGFWLGRTVVLVRA
jgi:hypothetical protein